MHYLSIWIEFMRDKSFEYYSKFETVSVPPQKQLITYSFNDHERTITGVMKEIKDLIFLYEYRGEYVGVEFFISFSKQSLSYKLIKVEELDAWPGIVISLPAKTQIQRNFPCHFPLFSALAAVPNKSSLINKFVYLQSVILSSTNIQYQFSVNSYSSFQ